MFAIMAQEAMDGGAIMSMDGRYIENAGAIFLQTIDLTNNKSFSTKQP